jgi:hypothetical protein
VPIIDRDRNRDVDPVAGDYTTCEVNAFQTWPDHTQLWALDHSDSLVKRANGTPVTDPVPTATRRSIVTAMAGRRDSPTAPQSNAGSRSSAGPRSSADSPSSAGSGEERQVGLDRHVSPPTGGESADQRVVGSTAAFMKFSPASLTRDKLHPSWMSVAFSPVAVEGGTVMVPDVTDGIGCGVVDGFRLTAGVHPARTSAPIAPKVSPIRWNIPAH